MVNIEIEKPKRKRGRPRKNPIPDENKDNYKKTREIVENIEQEIVLELPITMNDIKKFRNENTISNDESETNQKNIFEKASNSESIKPNNMFTLDDMTNQSSESNNSLDFTNGELLQKLKNKEKEIKRLKEDLEKSKKYSLDTYTSGTNEKYVHEINLELLDHTNGESVCKTQTNIACWYCTCKFTTKPFFLPDSIHNEKCYVLGCFCSPNCAAAYNVRRIDDYKTSERNSLLKQLYGLDEIILSSKPEVLEKFGGPISIEEYRRNNITNAKEYRLLLPPIVSIVPLVEEGGRESNTNNSHTKYYSRGSVADSGQIISSSLIAVLVS
jgi:hypothetical protein